ncbi:MAG TPA: S8 family serine peptidase [Bradyrhizobium sp.]|jgi:hypothetical protein
MKIAIIDSGINPDHPHVGSVAGGVNISNTGESGDYLDRAGHGTAVAGAIREKVPEAELYSVKVFDDALSTNIDVLIRAIEWSIAHRIDIVNLSLGTANPAHRIRFEAALTREVVIVSAYEHKGATLFPGSLDTVIGVALDWECPRDTYRVQIRGTRPVFHASGFPRSIPGVPPEQNVSGISFAVANMTGFVAQALRGGASRETLQARLIERAAQSRVA